MRSATFLAAALVLTTLPAVAAAQETQEGAPAPAPQYAPPPASIPPPTAAVEGTTAASPAAPPKKEKSGGYFGLSIGTGKGTMKSGGASVDINDVLATSGGSPSTLHMQLRGGFGTGDLLFGAQLNWTRSWVEVGGVSGGLDFMAVDLTATYWSQEMGLYTRIGFGPASYSWYVGDATSSSVSGFELMVGVGATMGGVGVGIDLFRQSYDAAKTGFDEVTYVLVTIGFDVY